MTNQPQRRAALTGRSLAEAQWATTPPAERSLDWFAREQILEVLRGLRRTSPRFAAAVAAHAEQRWHELVVTDQKMRGSARPSSRQAS